MMHRLIILLTFFLALPSFAELTVKPPKLPGLLNANIDPNADLFLIWDNSAAQLKRIVVSELDTRFGGGGGGTTWGGITGTLSNQTDLQTALDAKQGILSFGNLTSSTTGLTVSNGTGAVKGSGTSIAIQAASSSQPGLLASADFTSFAGAATATTAATSSNTASTIVKRDGSGNFTAGTITANLIGNVSGLVESYTGHIKNAENYTYVLDEYASFAKQVTNIRIACGSGTITADLKIGGTNITTCNGISVSTAATTTCDTGSSNDLGAGGRLTLVTTSNSTCVDLTFTVKTTRD